MGEHDQQVAEMVDVQTTAAETTRTVETTPATASTEAASPDLGKVRDLVLKAHPDVVPDLVRGSSVDELIDSVEPARSAYQRIADQVRGAMAERGGREGGAGHGSTTANASQPAVVQPPVVPAGGATNAVDTSTLAPESKIAQALAERRKK